MRIKVIVPVAIFFLVTILSIGWFSSQRENEMQMTNVKEGASRNMAILNEAVNSELQGKKSEVSRLVGLIEAGQNSAAEKLLAHFLAIGSVESSGSDYKWKLQNNRNKTKETELDLAWLKELKQFSAEESQYKVLAQKDIQGQVRIGYFYKYNLQGTSEGKQNLSVLAISKTPFLQALVDRISSDNSLFFLATEDGVALSHPQVDYVGSKMGESGWIAKAKVIGGVLTEPGKDARGREIISVYEKVQGTNLVSVSQAIVQMDSFFVVWGRILIFMSLLGFVCLAFLSYVINEEVLPNIQVLGDGVDKTVERVVERYIEKPSLQGVSPEVINETVRKILFHLKGPIVSILGHIQLAKGQGGIRNLSALEDEVRQIREWVDRLGDYVTPPNAKEGFQTYFLHDIVDSALKVTEGSLLKAGVKLARNVPTDLKVKVQPEELRFVIVNLIQNAIDGMFKVYKKELLIEGKKLDGKVVFEISDSGEGIPDENIEKVFFPFFSTRTGLDHKGLGLSSAQGLIRKFGGSIRIDTSPLFGAKVAFEIPISGEEAVPLSVSEVAAKLKFEKPQLPVSVPGETNELALEPKADDFIEKSLSNSQSKKLIDKVGFVEVGRVSEKEKSMELKPSWQESDIGDRPALLGPKVEMPNVKIESPVEGKLKKREIDGPQLSALINPRARQ